MSENRSWSARVSRARPGVSPGRVSGGTPATACGTQALPGTPLARRTFQKTLGTGLAVVWLLDHAATAQPESGGARRGGGGGRSGPSRSATPPARVSARSRSCRMG